MAANSENVDTPAARRSLRPRFSLRTFLILVTLACCWLGWHIHAARQQREAAERIRNYGATILYDYQVKDGKYDPQGKSWAPEWAKTSLGDDFFHPVHGIDLLLVDEGYGPEDLNKRHPAPLEHLAHLKHLRLFRFYGRQVDESNHQHLAFLQRLEHLEVREAVTLTDADLAPLQSNRLRTVVIDGCRLTDETLEHFSRMPRIEWLEINSDRLSDAGVVHLQRLKGLRTLVLGPSRYWGRPIAHEVTEKSLRFLLSHPDIRQIEVYNSRISDEFREQINQRFPNATINLNPPHFWEDPFEA